LIFPTAAFLILSNAESYYWIENGKDNKNSQETDLEGIEEPMRSAIKLMRKKLPDLELRAKLWTLGCVEKDSTLHCVSKKPTFFRTIIHYVNIYLTLRMFVRGGYE
jgi:hypothetical protein